MLVGDAAAAVEVVFVGSLEEVGVTALEVVGAASDELEVKAGTEGATFSTALLEVGVAEAAAELVQGLQYGLRSCSRVCPI